MKNRLIVVSQNLLKYYVEFSIPVVLRVNLAWHKDLKSATELLESYVNTKIFLDVPIGRKKPPSFNHELAAVSLFIAIFPNIEYVAISNVENANQVSYYQARFKPAKLVPKIESFIGVKNARDIIQALNYDDKVVMLDHQDLYAELIRMDSANSYLALVDDLAKICKEEKACLLRTVGVVFAEWKEDK